MTELIVGATVKIPCTVQPGAFPNERLITIKTDQKEISAFVNTEYLTDVKGENGFIEGKIISKSGDATTIKIRGSFFTGASGKASVNSQWANKHFEPTALSAI